MLSLPAIQLIQYLMLEAFIGRVPMEILLNSQVVPLNLIDAQQFMHPCLWPDELWMDTIVHIVYIRVMKYFQSLNNLLSTLTTPKPPTFTGY